MRNILVTGGAGFVGSNLGILWKNGFSGDRVVALDNLKRPGSELNLPRLEKSGIQFMRGDIRKREDLESLGDIDLVLDCAAEASAQAGSQGEDDRRYLMDTNVSGTLNCLEFARSRRARFVFLSSSRVYPIAALRNLPLREDPERLSLEAGSGGNGWSESGITEDFPLEGARSLYGATKFSSELFVQEYAATFGLEAIINRCGVLAGPWQMGKVEQGFMALWASQFLYGGRLAYRGFGGTGKQVRDILHVSDLFELLKLQLADVKRHSGKVYNVGGGAANSVSLLELSRLCSARSGKSLKLESMPETHPTDIPYYVSDNSRIAHATGWKPRKSVEDILDGIFDWLTNERSRLENHFIQP